MFFLQYFQFLDLRLSVEKWNKSKHSTVSRVLSVFSQTQQRCASFLTGIQKAQAGKTAAHTDKRASYDMLIRNVHENMLHRILG